MRLEKIVVERERVTVFKLIVDNRGSERMVRRFADIQEEICFRAVWRWAILESKVRGWNEKKT